MDNTNSKSCQNRIQRALQYPYACARAYANHRQNSCDAKVWKQCSKKWLGIANPPLTHD